MIAPHRILLATGIGGLLLAGPARPRSRPVDPPTRVGAATPSPTPSAGPATAILGHGVNLSANTDWSVGAAWVDARNLFRRWGRPDKPWEEAPGLRLTADGYPLADAGTLSYLKEYPDGRYRLSYRGSAAVSVAGKGRLAGPVVEREGVRLADIVVRHDRGEFLTLSFTKVDPDDPPRDLHLIRPGHEPGTTQVFEDDFLRRLRPFSTVRFMDWMGANTGRASAWSDRVPPGSFLKTGPVGVAYEDVIALANAAGKDAWINVPDRADDDHVRRLAALLRDGLRPGLKVTVEYSNELWNRTFPQSGRVLADAKANPTLTRPDDLGRLAEQVALRLAEIARIFREEFGGRADRVRPVLCGQSANPYFLERGLALIRSRYGAPRDLLSGIAIAPYIDLDPSADRPGLEMDGVFSRMDAFLAEKLSGWVARHKALADRYGLPLLAYEGGQHLVPFNPVDRVVVNEPLKLAAQGDARMGRLYRDLDAVWRRQGGGLFVYFTLVSPYGRSGYWGLLPGNSAAGSPKWDAVLEIVRSGRRESGGPP